MKTSIYLLLSMFIAQSLWAQESKKVALVINSSSYQEEELNLEQEEGLLLDLQNLLIEKDYDVFFVQNPYQNEVFYELERVKAFFNDNAFPDGARLDVFVMGRAFGSFGKSYLIPHDFDYANAVESSVELAKIADILHSTYVDELNICFELIDEQVHSDKFMYKWTEMDNYGFVHTGIHFSLANRLHRSYLMNVSSDVELMGIKAFLEEEKKAENTMEDPYMADPFFSEKTDN